MQPHMCPVTDTGRPQLSTNFGRALLYYCRLVTQRTLYLGRLCLFYDADMCPLSVAALLNSCRERFSLKIGVHGSFPRHTVSKPSCRRIVELMHCFMKVELGFRPTASPSSTVSNVSHLAFLSVDSVMWMKFSFPPAMEAFD